MPESSGYHLPWSILLAYELELRREAYRKVAEERITIAVALDAACRDTYLRDVHLVAPATLASATVTGGGRQLALKRKSPEPLLWNPNFANKGKGKGKGRGKGKKNNVNTNQLKSRVGPRLICYKYNNKDQTCNNQCGMLHVCQWCLGSHPKYECPKHPEP
eukprot:9023335-Karenia_brevis.AAC.1